MKAGLQLCENVGEQRKRAESNMGVALITG